MVTHPISPEHLHQALQWRYAVKKFDSHKKIPDRTWKVLEESLVLTPSSFGLQPWRFYVVTDMTVKSQLPAISWGQTQVRDASHIVVLTAKSELTTEDVERYIHSISTTRQVPVESLAGLKNVIINSLQNPPAGMTVREWNIRQVYIALGNLMTSAATLGIDTCPMEGIIPAKYDEILDCRKDGYETVVVCTLGYRAEDDKYAAAAKVRYPSEQLIFHIEQ
ncbi:NAD(P)H-dependent oxidoreductase [Planctopirus hydrillae]|uniref:NAD(P)H-dependent oxidoreductase n=1 Tax=Planctopirus hydrillae TaxID=1841610 RepID=A0A1C3EI24_9PLAN|nr:NAD(P)H-dependent oxidoreductase [Planctopirus hydrillae]